MTDRPLRILAILLGLGVALAPPAGHPAPEDAAALDRALGKALFDKLWVAAPSSTLASDGLGPLYNARSCAGCHPGGGGSRIADRAAPPPGLVLRLATGDGSLPDPVYGRQLQTQAILGQRPEAGLSLDWLAHDVPLAGGAAAELARPVPRLRDPAFGPFAPGLRTSLRIAPPLDGLGATAAIPEAEILRAEDPDDRDGDGVSGRANRTPEGIGRFGWKAQRATLEDQTASAFSLDIGLSSRQFPNPAGDCTLAQVACRAAPDGRDAEGVEIGGEVVRLVADYLAALPAPVPLTTPDETVAAGKALFAEIGCAACHRADYAGGARPYSDFLLHDMGAGLADGVVEGTAQGAEWRTAPLWGMARRTGGSGPSLLHDGRAGTLLAAILWHDGEARTMRDRVIQLAPAKRAALIAFLESL